MRPPPLVEFEPVALGPFEISRLSWAGAVVAAGFLLGLAVARAELRRRGLPASLALELFAAAAPAVLLASRVPALAASFPRFLHDGEALAAALAGPGSKVLGSVAALALAGAFAWASRKPAQFLDLVAPPGLLVAGSVAAASATELRAAVVVSAVALSLAGGGIVVNRRAARLRSGVLAVAGSGAAAALLVLAPRLG